MSRETSSQSSPEKLLLSNHKDYDIRVGWPSVYDTLPKLVFTEITEHDYLSLTPHIHSKLENLKIKESESAFSISTRINTIELKKYAKGDMGWEGYEYLGYYPSLKLYAVSSNWTAESMGFGELILIDSISGVRYNIISFGDTAVVPPIPSPENKYLVYYDNSMYQHKNCTIGILQVNSKRDPIDYLKEFTSFDSDYFGIEELFWIHDRAFVVKGYEEIYENEKWIKKFRYYQTSF